MSVDKFINPIMRVINNIFCYTKTITADKLPLQPWYIRLIAPLCWDPSGKRVEIPLMQVFIAILVTVISLVPSVVGGAYVVYVINSCIIMFLSIYLAIRFSYITKENSIVNPCDVFIIQTVVYVLFVDYMYNDFMKTFYTKVLKPVFLNPPIKIT